MSAITGEVREKKKKRKRKRPGAREVKGEKKKKIKGMREGEAGCFVLILSLFIFS